MQEPNSDDFALELEAAGYGSGSASRWVNKDVSDMKQAWLNEKFAPDILPYKKELVEDLLELVQRQQEMIDDSLEDTEHNFMVMLCQMELERVQHALQSYLRIRLWKLQKYHQLIAQSEKMRALLSEAELRFVAKFNRAVENHFHTNFLDLLPEGLQKLDDNANGLNMVREPLLDQPVFVRCLRDIGEFQIDDEDKDDTVDLQAGEIYVLPYRPIRGLIKKGDAQLV